MRKMLLECLKLLIGSFGTMFGIHFIVSHSQTLTLVFGDIYGGLVLILFLSGWVYFAQETSRSIVSIYDIVRGKK